MYYSNSISLITNSVVSVLKIRTATAFAVSLFCGNVSNSIQQNRKYQVSNTKIGTHDGTFHCDEALACYLLKLLPEYRNSRIIRTRDPNELKACDIVVDVGSIFDPSLHRYDHHQRSFNENMNSLNQEYPWKTKLSSAGLVYFYFGHRMISHILNLNHCDAKVKVLFKKMYENFIEEIDAVDNGIPIVDFPRYAITSNPSSRVKMLNPQWNSVSSDSDGSFHKAMELVGRDFMNKLLYYSNTWWPAIELLQMALKERHNIYSTGEIIELKDDRVPWKDHLLCLENELGIIPTVKFVIYPSSNGDYKVQCVPIEAESFENRISLLEEWRGLGDRELTKISGIPGCVFVHSSGFVGKNKSRDGAILMAISTLKRSVGTACP